MAKRPLTAIQRALQTVARRYSSQLEIIAGQPTHETHPELLADGELLPGMHRFEFKSRRQQLSSLLPAGALAVIPAAATQYMSGVIPYPYRQDADFLYLTGLMQHGIAVLQKPSSVYSDDVRYTLFVPEPSSENDQWLGAALNCDAAVHVFGADEAYPLTQFYARLDGFCKSASAVFFDADRHSSLIHQEWEHALALLKPRGLQPLRPLVHTMRWRKSGAEIALLRRAASLATDSMQRCMAATRAGLYEHQLAAMFEYRCKVNGASRLAYPSVVGSGADACIIHYMRNDKALRSGDLVLMDAGCEVLNYASDVTRTWPVSGKFTSVQRDVYEMVLEVHQRCVQLCRIGSTLRHIHQTSVQLVTDGLVQLGILRSSANTASSRRFYPHSVGHWLGLDTHDTPTIVHDKPLQPGVVLTIEPGVYIPDNSMFGHLRGIGVRIEDDVLVTDGEPEVMSAGVPWGVSEMEELVGSAAKQSL